MRTVAVLLCLLFAGSAEASTFWVNPSASGQHCVDSSTDPGSGSSSQTITQGLACVGSAGTDAGAGDTVMVLNGTYAEQLIDKIPNGSSNVARFTLKSVNKGGAVIRPTVGGSIVGLNNTVHYITINGFVLDGTGYTGSDTGQDGITFSSSDYTTMHDITVTNLEVHDVPDNAIQAFGVNFEISFNYAHDTGIERSGGGTGFAHSCYCALKDSKVFGNRFFNAQGYGLHINTASAFFPSGQDHVSENTDYFDNVFSGNGFGGKQWGALLAGRNIRFYNNILYGNNAAIIVGHGVAPVTDLIFIYNNTIYHNNFDVNGYGGVLLQGQTNTTVQNNIIIQSNRPWDSSFDTPLVFDHQICDQSITGCTNADPLFKDTVNNDFRLQTGSPAINMGVDLSAVFTTDFTGATRVLPFDIGAYEFTTVGSGTVVAAYSFREGNGTTTKDKSGEGNNAALSGGATWTVSGKYGDAIMFDGTGSVAAPNSPSLNLTNGFSLQGWFYPTAESGFNAGIVRNYVAFLYPYTTGSGICPDGAVLAGLNNGTGNTVVCDPTPIPLNTWTDLAVTWDGATLSLYRNGTLVTTAAASTTLPATSNTLQIGNSQFTEGFVGRIDNVRVSNGAFSQAQVTSNMTTPIDSALAVQMPAGFSLKISGGKSFALGQ